MLIINGNTITLVYEGKSYTKEVSAEELSVAAIHAGAQNYEEILLYCFPTPANLLKKEGFYEENGSVYYKNIKVSIPSVLAYKMVNAEGEELQRLINFWCWLSLNPNPRSRENLYKWIEENDVQLTNGGLMVLYRRVVAVWSGEKISTEMLQFLVDTYDKLRKQKKSTNVKVYYDDLDEVYTLKETDEDGYDNEYVGNLKELIASVGQKPAITHYTDDFSRTKKYMIGVEEREPRELGDESDATCSRGIHAGSRNFGFSGFGDTPIAIVVNPADVLNSVEGQTKIRFCAMTPVAVLNKDCEWIDDQDVHQKIDAAYDAQIERLNVLLQDAKFEDFKTHQVLNNEYELGVQFKNILDILN